MHVPSEMSAGNFRGGVGIARRLVASRPSGYRLHQVTGEICGGKDWSREVVGENPLGVS